MKSEKCSNYKINLSNSHISWNSTNSLTQRVARSLWDSWASCCFIVDSVLRPKPLVAIAHLGHTVAPHSVAAPVAQLLLLYVESLASPAMGHRGTCPPPQLTTIYFFRCTLTYTKSDSDYMLTVVSCEHPVTCVPLLAPNPGDATASNHWLYRDQFVFLTLQFEVAEDTALPLSIEVPGIDIWAEPKSFHVRPDERGRRGWYRQPDVRYLTVGKQAYRFLRRGDNHFFCAALEWRSGARGVGYFTVRKVWPPRSWRWIERCREIHSMTGLRTKIRRNRKIREL